MSYLLLIVEPAEQRSSRPVQARRDAYRRMLDYTEQLRQRGVLLASDSLRTEAVRVSVREGRQKVIDGPFTEAKEFVGGFFLLDCPTREQALGLASECPAAEWACIEVREIGPCYG